MKKKPHPLFIQALQAFQEGAQERALQFFLMLLEVEPKNFDALHIMGVLMAMKDDHKEAINYFLKAIKVNAINNLAHFNLAKALSDSGDDLAAFKYHINATKLAPTHAEAWLNYGKSLSKLSRFEEAIQKYNKALQIKPNLMEAMSNKGAVFNDLGLYEEALKVLNEAVQINPNHPETWSNKGIAHGQLKQFEVALSCYEQAISLKHDYIVAWSNKGTTFKDLRLFDQAVQCYDHIINIQPKLSEAWVKKADALEQAKNFIEALLCYETAIELDPEFYCLLGHYLHGKNNICDWTNFESNLLRCEQNVRSGIKSVSPFIGLSLFDDPTLQLMIARSFASEARFTSTPCERKPHHKTVGDKIIIGYFSPEFHNHPVSFLIAEMIELHDRDKFEVIGFSLGPKTDDAMRQRLSKAFDKFIDVHRKNSTQIVQICDDLGIDIAIDLCGYTGLARLDLFAKRVAPVQLSYLGFMGSSGLDSMDYIIADEIVIPETEKVNFSEKIIYLPYCYQVSDRSRVVSERIFTRAELGLPEKGMIFCCFNNSYKIRPNLFDYWIRILQRVEGSILWLLQDNQYVVENLRSEAEKRGLDSKRIVFAARVPNEDHLARLKVADLFLDTAPCNAGATANEFLYAGVPVLTLQGKTFVSRMCSSLLHSVNLPELVVESFIDYENKAVELALNPQMLNNIKVKLAAECKSSPLFDTARITKDIEAAYEQILEKSITGLPPDHIYVNYPAITDLAS